MKLIARQRCKLNLPILITAAYFAALPTWNYAAEESPVTIPIHRLSLDVATKAATAAIEACRKEGVNVTVAVIDRGGREQVVLRDTLAMPLTLEVAKQKAYAAMNFNTPTSQLESRFTSPFSPGKVEGIVLSAGGIPIEAGGTIIGGIGVSGAPSGSMDEKCAQAGLTAIIDELEMSL